MILFFRSILQDLDLEQTNATVLYEDNSGALLMANAQQPTRRTRHMDIKKFALLEWVEQDLMILHDIKTAENAADGLTKPLMKQLFYRHADTMMGRRVPGYVEISSITRSVYATTEPGLHAPKITLLLDSTRVILYSRAWGGVRDIPSLPRGT